MTQEHEFIFNQLVNPIRHTNFADWTEYGEVKVKKSFHNVKFNVIHNHPSGKVKEYNIKLMDFHSNKLLLTVNYQSDAVPFIPNTEFYEPTWKDFTKEQLLKAIKYLTPLVNMRFEEDPDYYMMLVFKDKFHLSIRHKCKNHSGLEHNLCITAHDIELDEIKL